MVAAELERGRSARNATPHPHARGAPGVSTECQLSVNAWRSRLAGCWQDAGRAGVYQDDTKTIPKTAAAAVLRLCEGEHL